ncbi:unnamed protein product, partial [Meganyctiphanes norvegica]
YITAISAINGVVPKMCNTVHKYLKNLTWVDPNPCPDFRIVPEHYFFPYQWNHAERPFKDKSFDTKSLEVFNQSYVIHFASGRTQKTIVKLGAKSMYEESSRRFCPFIFSTLQQRNVAF